jgi:hypothetical protein
MYVKFAFSGLNRSARLRRVEFMLHVSRERRASFFDGGVARSLDFTVANLLVHVDGLVHEQFANVLPFVSHVFF